MLSCPMDLPENCLLCILENLPRTEAVRTAVVCHAWANAVRRNYAPLGSGALGELLWACHLLDSGREDEATDFLSSSSRLQHNESGNVLSVHAELELELGCVFTTVNAYWTCWTLVDAGGTGCTLNWHGEIRFATAWLEFYVTRTSNKSNVIYVVRTTPAEDCIVYEHARVCTQTLARLLSTNTVFLTAGPCIVHSDDQSLPSIITPFLCPVSV